MKQIVAFVPARRRTLIALLGALATCFFAASHRASPRLTNFQTSDGHAEQTLFVATRWDLRRGNADGPIPETRALFANVSDATAFCGGKTACSVETALRSAPHAFASSRTLPILPAFLPVPGRDGFHLHYAGKEAWITPAELLAMQAYDHGKTPFPGAEAGIDEELVLARAAQALGTSAALVRTEATVERVRFETPIHPDFPPTANVEDLLAGLAGTYKHSPKRPARADVLSAIGRGAGYLDRHLSSEGRFDYLVQGTTGLPRAGYVWARHAGTLFFLAQAAGVTKNEATARAAERALHGMASYAVRDCGAASCVAAEDENVVGVGATALAVIALAEFEHRKLPGADPALRKRLLQFLLGQRLPNGAVAHQYDRTAQRVIPSKLPYYDGEVALAFARSFPLDNDPVLRDAATALLTTTVQDTPKGYAGLLFSGEEHWTCQALDALWDATPNPAAYARCLSWHRFQGAQQFTDSDSPFDAAGAFGPTAIFLPRVTPAASRSEAAGATLAVALRAPERATAADTAFLRDQLDAAVIFLLREQLPGRHRAYLADPAAMDGGFPASPVDLRVQIDYVQHTGSCLVRWLELDALSK